jgi:exodeoxyribonuclease X
MRWAVVDTETTGIGEKDVIVEIAIVTADDKRTTLVNPGDVPVSVEARAAHHITDEELRDAPTLVQLVNRGFFEPLATPDVAIVAHNAEFDLRMLRQSGLEFAHRPVICTWRCALHLWPEAPRHGNQHMRYFLDLAVPSLMGAAPHRALPDAVVTRELLLRCLERATLEELVDYANKPVLLSTIFFGKHRGTAWADAPSDYLSWVLSRDFDADVMYTARHHLQLRKNALAASAAK